MVSPARRAALFGLGLVALGCDVAQFAIDPKPAFDETWNLPGPSLKMSVAQMLPTNGTVSIYSTPASTPPDSIAFALTIAPASISQNLGTACAPCAPLNGTNAIKPAFTLNAGSSTPLPNTVASAALLSGSIVLTLTNNMSFDPLYVKTGPGTQGFMVISVVTGTTEIGHDSVAGATTPVGPTQTRWGPGSVLTRSISLLSGNVTSSFTVNVTINSPAGDHLEPINTSGTANASAAVNNLLVGSVGLNVSNSALNTGGTGDTVNLEGISGSFVRAAALQMTFTNPFALTGNLTVNFKYGPNATDTVQTGITIPSGNGTRTAGLTQSQVQKLLDKKSIVTVTGGVTSTGTIVVTPKQAIAVDNRLVVTVRTPTGGK